jgi:hypothetical protein
MLTFKQFLEEKYSNSEEIDEANLGSHPDNYPAGSVVRVNKGIQFDTYKSGDILKVDFISNNPKKDRKIIDVVSAKVNPANILFIGFTDEKGKSFQVKISKSNADQYFVKGSRSKGGTVSSVIFSNKQLSPQNLGFSKEKITASQIIERFKKNDVLTKEQTEFLSGLLIAANKKGNTITVSIPEEYQSEINIIAKDFGELICGVWITKNFSGIKQIEFPKEPNFGLVDIFGIEGKKLIPFSIKSAGGSKVTIGNILNAIDDMIKNSEASIGIDISFTPQEESDIQIMKKIISLPMKDGMIEGHKLLKTKAIKELSKVIGVSVDKINNKVIDEWLDTNSNKKIIRLLDPFFKAAGSVPLKVEREKNRLVISPLGESLKRLLNQNESILKTLNKLANLIEVTQLNINISPTTMTISVHPFIDSSFRFAWAGYSGGNKIGFEKTKG